MKKYIMSLAVVLLAALGLTSCHDDFNDTTEYPLKQTYGVWQSLNADDGKNNYYVVCTKNIAGNDILYVVRQEIASGAVRTLFVGEVDQYDKTIGLLTASAPISFFGDGENGTDSLETLASFAVQKNGVTRTLQLEDETGFEVVQEFTPTNVLPTIAGYWEAYNEETGDLIALDLYEDNSASVNLNDGTYIFVDGEYVYENGQGTVTDENGNSATLTFNGAYQLVATVNGVSMVVDPYVSESNPEVFEKVGSALFTCPGYTESEKVERVDIEASTSVPGHYRLVSPFHALIPESTEGYHIDFYYDAATGEFTMDEKIYYIGDTYDDKDVFIYYYPSQYPQYCYLANQGNVFVITSLFGAGKDLVLPKPITFTWDEGFPGAEAAPKLQPAKKAPRHHVKRSLGKKVKAISSKVLAAPVNIKMK